MTTQRLPMPRFFDPANAGRWGYRPEPPAIAAEVPGWRATHGLRPSSGDARATHLLIIDAQKDFCFPEGALYVGGRSGRGAIDDNARLAAFVYAHLDEITEITCTFDTHHPFQIFFPAFWLDADGKRPGPHRAVAAEDLEKGRLRPNPDLAPLLTGGDVAKLNARALHYCRALEAAGKYQLWLWPPHCLQGTDGNALAGVVQEARYFHALCRLSPARAEVKGEHPLSENYSVLRPEVLTDETGAQVLSRNDALIDRLLRADRLLVAGQASSHCVKSTVEDLLTAIEARDPALARKVTLLSDCMSAVAVPDGKGGLAADFTPQAEQALARFAAAGMRVVTSEEALG